MLDDLPAIRGPAIICIQAGNVNTGALDPADAICEHVRRSDAWVHFGDAETKRRVIAAVQAQGTCWCGGSVWQGTVAIGHMVLAPRCGRFGSFVGGHPSDGLLL